MSSYIEVFDEEYKGLDITIFTTKDDGESIGFDVDVKHACGEVIEGRCDLSNHQEAYFWAKGFIDGYTSKEK